MLTPREQAAGAYSDALAQGRGLVLGADMTAVVEGRLANLRATRRLIVKARDTERNLRAEPDDASLDRMLTRVQGLEDGLEADRPRLTG